MQRYEKYKESGVDWIGEIPEGWDVRKIKYLFQDNSSLYIDGDWIESKDIFGEDIYYFTTGNIQELNFKETDFALISNDTFKKLNCTEAIEGDLLVSRLNLPLGRTCIAPKFDKKAIVAVDVVIFRCDNNYNRRFLLYLMNSPNYFLNNENEARGAIMKRISRSLLGNVKIPIPPLPEQTAIATFLDDKTAKIDQTIGIKEKEIELLKERRQILIQKAVTKGLDDTVPLKDSGVDWIGEIPEHWEVRKLKQVCKINVNSLDERTNPNYEFEYIDIGSVTYENGIINREYFLFKNAPSRARRIAKEGDTIVSTVRTYLKAIDFIDKSKSECIFSTGFAVLQPNKEVFPRYLFSFIKSDAFTEQVSVNSKGMSYPAINSTELGAQKILFIPYEEQIHIVSYLEVIEEKIAKAILLKQQEIEKLKEYKTVLIDQVVTGKVRVS